MVELASRQVPSVSFRCVDVRELPVDEGSFDAVCVYFSLLQLDRSEQRDVVRRLARALTPDGHLVLATVPLDVEGVEAVFMGQPVRVTSFGAPDLVAVAEEAGLDVLEREETLFTPAHPDAGPEPHVFCTAAGAGRHGGRLTGAGRRASGVGRRASGQPVPLTTRDTTTVVAPAAPSAAASSRRRRRS